VCAIHKSSCFSRCLRVPIAMRRFYKPSLWIPQLFLLANPNLHHGLLATTYSTSSQLQAQVAAADIANAGSAAVTVINPSPGGGNSGSAEFIISATSNLVPSLTSLSPSSVNAGSAAFILTLTGSNFIPTSTIQWNGAVLPSTYLSETQIEVQIPASNATTPGFAEVMVLNPAPGGGSSTTLVFTVNYGPTIVSQLTNDLVWDPTHQLIYLSVPSLASSHGNTISSLDPTTGSIRSSQFAGSEPDVLTISGDDQFLYAGLDGASAVRRFTLPALLADIKYSLEADPYYGPYFALDLQVAPGLSHTTAVSRGVSIVGPWGLGGMAIYDDATRRPKVADTPGPLYDSLQWGSDTSIYAINSEISSYDFYVLTADATGVALSKDYQSEFSNFYIRSHYDTGTKLVYTDDGYVINPTNGNHVGGFQAAGLMIPDSGINSAFFLGQTASQFGTQSFTIESFNLTTFAPIAELVIPNVQGYPLRFIRWGAHGLAFSDDAGYVYIVNSPFVADSATQLRAPRRYVNPVQKTTSVPRMIRPSNLNYSRNH
jgi:hypothetical protein